MNAMRAQDWVWLLPEGILIGVSIILLVLDLASPDRRWKSQAIGWLSFAGVVASFVAVVAIGRTAETVRLFGDSIVVDGFAVAFKLVILAAAGLVALMSIGTVREPDVPVASEYFCLLPLAVAGAMVVVSSGDLVALYVGLELMSVSTYVLVAVRKQTASSAEAAFKYLTVSGIASAVTLYGMSFLYGVAGTTNLEAIGRHLPAMSDRFDGLLVMALALVVAGVSVKTAAAPFHAWAPDVYQGAPSAAAAFLAAVSKVAAVGLLIRLVVGAFGPHHVFGQTTSAMIALVAATAMIVGNAVALRERNVRRLIALSGVANAGYLLVPLAVHAGRPGAVEALTDVTVFYALAYAVMTVGALAVSATVAAVEGHEDMSAFAGLYHRAPLMAWAMVVLLMSLAGLPPTGGFVGKLLILLDAVRSGMYGLAAVLAVTSVVSFYYYFAVARQMFLRTSGGPAVSVSVPVGATVAVCAAATLALGLYPQGWTALWP